MKNAKWTCILKGKSPFHPITCELEHFSENGIIAGYFRLLILNQPVSGGGGGAFNFKCIVNSRSSTFIELSE